jgi:hypothetical protein
LLSSRSFLGQGYRLNELIEVAEEMKKIRTQRQASLKGTKWDTFKAVFQKRNVFGILVKDVLNGGSSDTSSPAASDSSSSQSRPKTLAARSG